MSSTIIRKGTSRQSSGTPIIIIMAVMGGKRVWDDHACTALKNSALIRPHSPHPLPAECLKARPLEGDGGRDSRRKTMVPGERL